MMAEKDLKELKDVKDLQNVECDEAELENVTGGAGNKPGFRPLSKSCMYNGTTVEWDKIKS